MPHQETHATDGRLNGAAVEVCKRLDRTTFGIHAPLLLRNGYSPLPVEPGAKRPLGTIGDWGRFRDTPLTLDEIGAIAARHPDVGIGVVGGYNGLVPIDIDSEDEAIIAAITTALPPPLARKLGRRGTTCFFRAREPISARKFRRPEGAMMVEVLTTGQTVIPPTLHPETAQPYRWIDDDLTLFTVPVEELSQITAGHIAALEAALAQWTAPRRKHLAPRSIANEPTLPTRMRAYAGAALRAEAELLRNTQKGGRNRRLFDAACKLGRYVHHDVLTTDELESALFDSCRTNGLMAEEGQRACQATIASGLHKADGDDLPVLGERSRKNGNGSAGSSTMDCGEIERRVLEMMDLGLSDKEIEADIGPLPNIAALRRQWNGEGRRVRAHARSAVNGGARSNVQIDGTALLDRTHTFLGRFVAFPSEDAHVAHTLWIAHTHAMDAWDTTPRLAFLSPEPASGKTRALEASELLVPNPIEAVNVSPAYLFRKVGSPDGRPTILFDEIDTVFGPKAGDHEDLRALLNAGHRKGALVGRCVVRGKAIDTEETESYCAVALAGLGNLPETILSRSVVVRMRRRAPDERVEPFRRRLLLEEGERLRSDLTAWAASAIGDVIDAWPDIPEQIKDRDADIWEALLTVADVAGGEWPARARAAALALVAQSKESSPSLGLRLLADIRAIFETAEMPDVMPTEAILRKLHALPEAPWSDMKGKPITDRWLSSSLSKYEIKPGSIRVGDSVLRGYKRTALHDAWMRYLPSSPEKSATSAAALHA